MYDYVCTICGAFVERPELDYHAYNGCPYCGQDLLPAVQCQGCTELVSNTGAEHALCGRCKAAVLKRFQAFLADQDEAAIEFLEDFQDGRYWRDWRTWTYPPGRAKGS